MTDESAARLKQRALDHIDAHAHELLNVSRAIHAKPELAFAEFEACALLAATAGNAGLATRTNVGSLPTAFSARTGAGTGPTIALLAEYDALPGMGHACGHNLIATSALGAALALHSLSSELDGGVLLLGTPAEERGGGKEIMARHGAFDGVDAALMIHPAGVNLATMPCICVAEVHVSYVGRAAHASAMPHKGLNALDALLLAYQAISNLRQHIRGSERIHGIITKGGDAPNIVPALTEGEFYVRAANARDLARLKPRVQACFEAGATATGCSVDVRWGTVDYLDLNTNWPLAECFQANAEQLGRQFIPMGKFGTNAAGSTDMGNVSYRLPAIHPLLAAAPADVVIHHPDFARWAGSEMGDQAALDGARALAMTTIDYLTSEPLRAASLKAFDLTTHLTP